MAKIIILKALFTWFQVILCSSDSFMHNWLGNNVGNDRFNAVVIGYLSRKEAKVFWDTKIAINGFGGREALPFNEAYEVCGGSMFLLHET